MCVCAWFYCIMYSRRQYKVSVPCRLPTVPYFKKTPSKTVPFYSAGRDAILLLYAIRILGGIKFEVDFSSLFIPLLFFPPVSYSAVPLQSIDCFCSSRRLIASLLARFALIRRRKCFCSYSRQFRFSPSIVYVLRLARSASVRRLFLLFSSINSFSSRQFRSSPSIVSAVLAARSASVR